MHIKTRTTVKSSIFSISLISAILFLFISAPAFGQNIKDMQHKLSKIDTQLGTIKIKFDHLNSATIDIKEESYSIKAEQSYDEGYSLYSTGDYKNASLALFEAVKTKSFKKNKKYVEALYYLAESLYQDRNFVGARNYYAKYLNKKGKKYAQESLNKIMLIAEKLNNYSNIDKYYLRLTKLVPIEKINKNKKYIFAKSLYKKNDFKGSLKAFESIYLDSPNYYRAVYFKGTIFVILKNYAKAEAEFIKITSKLANNRQEKKLYELSLMSLARLYFEQEKFKQAITHYQKIKRDSSLFADALYELCWTYLTKGMYEQDNIALQNAQVGFDSLILEQQSNLKALERLVQKLRRALSDPSKSEEKEKERIKMLETLVQEIENVELLTVQVDTVSKEFEQLRKEGLVVGKGRKTTKRLEGPSVNKATHTLDIMLLKYPESKIASDARLLKSNILLKQKNYDEAEKLAHKVVNDFSKNQKSLDSWIEKTENPVKYFNELLAKSKSKSTEVKPTDFMPENTVEWASDQQNVSRALYVVNDIQSGNQMLEETRNHMDKLITLMNQGGSLDMFPVLKKARTQATEIENKLITIKNNLLNLEEKIAFNKAGDKDVQELQSLKKESSRLNTMFDSMPKTSKDVQARQSTFLRRIARLESLVASLKNDILDLSRQFDHIKKWSDDSKNWIQDDSKGKKKFLKRIRTEEKNIKDMMGLIEDISDIFAVAKAKGGVGVALTKEDNVRQNLSDNLAKQKKILKRIRNKLTNEERTLLSKFDTVSSRLEKLQANVKRFYVKIDDKSNKSASHLIKQAKKERRRLKKYKKLLQKMKNKSANLVGSVAYDSLKDVKAVFNDYSLQADLALTDIVWERKQDVSKEAEIISMEQMVKADEIDKESKEVLMDIDY